jgi:hypothetical protein
MKKLSVVLMCVMVLGASLFMSGCKKKGAVAGKANSGDVAALLPDGAIMVMAFNVQKFGTMSFFEKMKQEGFKPKEGEPQTFKDYADFVQKTGVDPQKDVFFVTAGIYGKLEDKEPDMLAIINLTYNKAKILDFLKSQSMMVTEESFEGVSLFTVKEINRQLPVPGTPKSENVRLAFLNDWNVAIGSPDRVKAAISLTKGTGKMALESEGIKSRIAAINQSSLFWFVLSALPDSVKKNQAGSMMGIDTSKLEALVGQFDFDKKILSGFLKVLAKDPEGNKKLVDMLNGFKGMAAMGASKDSPEVGELVNGITLTASADAINLNFSIKEEVMNKLGEKAKAKVSSMAQPVPAEPVVPIGEDPAKR